VQAAQLGCEVATAPAKVLRAMLEHPLTAAGIKRFADDWAAEPRFGQWLDGLVGAQAVG
jgi:transaldolase